MILNVLLVIYVSFSLINTVFMFALHLFHDRKGYYKTAAGIWIGIFLSFLADGIVTTNFGFVNHIFAIPLITITMFCFAKLTRDIYRVEIPFKSLAQFSIATWFVGVVLHYFFQASFMVSSLVICLGIVAPVFVAVHGLFKSSKKLSIIDQLFGFTMAAEAVHILDYPFLRPIEGAAVFGFSLALLLIYIASILIPVVINRKISADLSDTLELKVQERTAQLLDVKQKLTQATKMSALGEMAGGVAHEINNPLATIKTLCGQLQEVVDDELLDHSLVKNMSNQIERTTDRIAKIVQGLRLFSRDSSGDPFSSVNVDQLITETLSFCGERFKNGGTELMVEDFNRGLCFDGRSTEISQVLLNLLNNAYDAIENLKNRWVKISVVDEQDFVKILVTDSGSGIPVDVQAKIFQPFFTTKEVGKGTGMGLSISSGIIQSHKGELRLDNECSNTRFVLRLPKQQKPASQKTVA